jgi:hypothetical protein
VLANGGKAGSRCDGEVLRTSVAVSSGSHPRPDFFREYPFNRLIQIFIGDID